MQGKGEFIYFAGISPLAFTKLRYVPKFSSKVKLNNKGLIVDGFSMNKNWSEQELREKLQVLFENKLRDRHGEVIR